MIQINRANLKTAIQMALGSRGIWTPDIEMDLIIEITNLSLKQNVAEKSEQLVCNCGKDIRTKYEKYIGRCDYCLKDIANF